MTEERVFQYLVTGASVSDPGATPPEDRVAWQERVVRGRNTRVRIVRTTYFDYDDPKHGPGLMFETRYRSADPAD